MMHRRQHKGTRTFREGRRPGKSGGDQKSFGGEITLAEVGRIHRI